MHRSASTTRIPDDLLLLQQRSLLPTYDPLYDLAKKESSRSRSAEHAVHLIPLLLIACAFLLWLFSSPHIPVIHGNDQAVVSRNATVDAYSRETTSVLETEGNNLESVALDGAHRTTSEEIQEPK